LNVDVITMRQGNAKLTHMENPLMDFKCLASLIRSYRYSIVRLIFVAVYMTILHASRLYSFVVHAK